MPYLQRGMADRGERSAHASTNGELMPIQDFATAQQECRMHLTKRQGDCVDLVPTFAGIATRPQWNCKPKDCEERCVLISERLIDSLPRLKSTSGPNPVLFSNQLDQPELYSLGNLETLVRREGLRLISVPC